MLTNIYWITTLTRLARYLNPFKEIPEVLTGLLDDLAGREDRSQHVSNLGSIRPVQILTLKLRFYSFFGFA